MTQICVPVLALIVLCTIGLNCSEAKSGRRGCCTMFNTAKVPIKAIKAFSIQSNKGKCRLNAVIFHIVRRKKAKSVCVDHNLPWVSSAIEKFKQKDQKIKKMQRRKKQ
ncbi:C-C motif chemokine 20-like [Engraulis encrasicolus]|uniref:C-C motif chemokine 20-like n=1 Tax=Engraulis encrasicolus TaxID=184585 RepID=UPI002FCFBFA3